MTAGSFARMPATMRHYVVVKSETILQVHGTGPFVLTYVNPADDPRGAAPRMARVAAERRRPRGRSRAPARPPAGARARRRPPPRPRARPAASPPRTTAAARRRGAGTTDDPGCPRASCRSRSARSSARLTASASARVAAAGAGSAAICSAAARAAVRSSGDCRVQRPSRDLVEVHDEVAPVRGVVERQHLGVREPQRHHAPQPRHRRVVGELGIADARHPGVAVVRGVVDAVRTVEREVHRRDAEVVQEDRVVAAAAEHAAPTGRRPWRPRRRRSRPCRARAGGAPHVVEGAASLRVGDAPGRLVRERAQRGHGADGEPVALGRGVDVQARDRVRRAALRACSSPHSVEPVSVNSSASQIPNTIVRRGRVAALRQLAERAAELQRGRGAGRRVDAAERPGVVVVRQQHQLVAHLRVGAAQPRDHVRIVRVSRGTSRARRSRAGPGPTW